MLSLNIDTVTSDFSLQNAYFLANLSRLAYQPRETVQNTLKTLKTDTFFLEKDDTQAFIAINNNVVILAFRGTSSIRDWMTNSDLLLTPFLSGSGKVHQGFSKSLDRIWKEILVFLETNQKKQPLLITGHSLGGALAVLSAARFSLEQEKFVRGVYTFGQPRIGDRFFALKINSIMQNRIFRFVNNNDLVTRIPTREMFYTHAGIFKFFDSDGKLYYDISKWNEFLEAVKGSLKQKLELLPSFIKNHNINLYIKNISKNINYIYWMKQDLRYLYKK